MMKTTLVMLSVALAALSASPVLAMQETTTIKHRSADGKSHEVKFYTTPLGHQCAYDETKDPSLYPCKEQGVCVRLNATYGKCFTEAEATQIRKELDSADGSDDSESDSGSDDGSASGSGSGSYDEVGFEDEVEFEDEDVGSGEGEEQGEDGEEDDEEEEEDEVIIVRTDPPAH